MCVCVCVCAVSQSVSEWTIMSVQSTTSSKSVCVVIALCVILVLVTHSTTLASSAGTTLLQPFNGLFSRTTWVSRYQKGKTNLDFTGARDSEWQWHQLGHMQVCTSLQTDNHASTPPLSFYRPDALPAAQPTASKHWRQVLHCLLLFLSTSVFYF